MTIYLKGHSNEAAMAMQASFSAFSNTRISLDASLKQTTMPSSLLHRWFPQLLVTLKKHPKNACHMPKSQLTHSINWQASEMNLNLSPFVLDSISLILSYLIGTGWDVTLEVANALVAPPLPSIWDAGIGEHVLIGRNVISILVAIISLFGSMCIKKLLQIALSIINSSLNPMYMCKGLTGLCVQLKAPCSLTTVTLQGCNICIGLLLERWTDLHVHPRHCGHQGWIYTGFY